MSSGLSLIGPDISLDIRLLVVSDETPQSDVSESIAMALATHLAAVVDGPGHYSRLRQTTVVRGAGCRQQLVHPWLNRMQAEARTQRHILGACWRSRSSRPSLSAHWLCGCTHDGGWTFGGCKRNSVRCVAAAGRHRWLLLWRRVILSSFRRAGEIWNVEMVLIKTNSSCLSVMRSQGLSENSSCHFCVVALLKTVQNPFPSVNALTS